MTTIGTCIGCDRTVIVNEESICSLCLQPPRGRRWAHILNRVRTDRAYALAMYCRIQSAEKRAIFERFYGRPTLMLVPRGQG